jgi:chromosome partitioning protein
MAKVIAICNQKGGVGKSTTAVNVGSYLAIAGKRTLLIDLDPQGNATICSGIDRAQVRNTVSDMVMQNASLESLILHSPMELLDVVPSNIELSQADLAIADAPERERIILKALEPLAGRYDVILFDCAPSLGLLTINALVAAEGVLIPVQCEYLALEGLSALVRTIERVRATYNPRLKIFGITLTMADFRTTLTQEVSNEVRGFFKDLVMKTSIPRNVRLAEAPSFGKPICLYDPHSSGALAYDSLAKELIGRIFVGQPGGTS